MRVEPTLEAFAGLVAEMAPDAIPVEVRRHAALVVAGDPRIRALARRVEVVEDPALNAGLPLRRPARVEVRLTDGSVPSREVDTAAGDFERPYPREALREKFLALAAPVLGRPGAAAAWHLCHGVEGFKSARELGGGLRAIGATR